MSLIARSSSRREPTLTRAGCGQEPCPVARSFTVRSRGQARRTALRADRREPCYTRRVTTEDVIAHWRKGAKNALRVAVLAHEDGEHELALFHCHLAVEKALKKALNRFSYSPCRR